VIPVVVLLTVIALLVAVAAVIPPLPNWLTSVAVILLGVAVLVLAGVAT
jgi:hypothetical protein